MLVRHHKGSQLDAQHGLISRRTIVASALGTAALVGPHRADAFVFTQLLRFVAGRAALALFDGAVQYVAGKIMANALGDTNTNNKDVKEWVDGAVNELKAYVREELDIRDVRKMQSDLYSVRDAVKLLSAFDSAEDKMEQRGLATNCDMIASSLVYWSVQYPQAYFISSAAMAYRLFCRQFQYSLEHKPGYISTLQDSMNEYVRDSIALRQTISQGLVTREPNMTKNFLNWSTFNELADGGLATAVSCYDRMCTQIGARYVCPYPVPRQLGPTIL
jgi:hypothetical protein